MTDEAVHISITIKVEGVTKEIEEKVLATAMEESAHTLVLLVG